MIFFIRHGETDWNLNQKIQGKTDISLNKNGRLEAIRIAGKMKNKGIQKILSSNLIRAKETAEIISKLISVEVSYDSRLQERNYGLIEGSNKEVLDNNIWALLEKKPESFLAEPIIDLYKRVDSIVKELIIKKDNILVVTHGGTLRMILYCLENNKEFNLEIYNKKFKDIKIKHVEEVVYNNDNKGKELEIEI